MLPSLYLILIRKNGSPYPEVTVVSLPSSLMIVHSNAFVYSTSLLVVVSRYGSVPNGTYLILVFPEQFITLINVVTSIQDLFFSHRYIL
jgi:hypothetical protein